MVKADRAKSAGGWLAGGKLSTSGMIQGDQVSQSKAARCNIKVSSCRLRDARGCQTHAARVQCASLRPTACKEYRTLQRSHSFFTSPDFGHRAESKPLAPQGNGIHTCVQHHEAARPVGVFGLVLQALLPQHGSVLVP